jgi:hypothetical protein
MSTKRRDGRSAFVETSSEASARTRPRVEHRHFEPRDGDAGAELRSRRFLGNRRL